MKNYLFLAAITALTISLASCTKSDDKTTTPTPTKTELLTAKGWKITEATVNGVDAFSNFDACERDNILTFKTNFTAITDEGATKCDPNDPQTITETWSFASNETKVILDGEEATLLILNSTTLKIEAINGADKYTVTYTAQ